MRRLVVAADVGLDLDDATDPATRRIVPDEPRTDQAPRGLERRLREDRPVEDAQLRV